MDPHKRSALLLSLIDKLKQYDSWCGETHVQKATYFLQTLAGIDLRLDFVLYKHGPFSFDLRDELSHMRANQLVKLVPKPPYGPQLRPTETGRELLDRFPKTLSRHRNGLEFVAECLGDANVAELERLATALFVVSEEGTDPTEGAKRLHEIKPHIGIALAKQGIEQVLRWKENLPTA